MQYFFEILFGFFATIGIVYLTRDLLVYLQFRKKHFGHTAVCNISALSFDEIAALLRHYRHLLESPRASALIGRIALLYDPASEECTVSHFDLLALVDCFDEPIEVITKKEWEERNADFSYFL